MSYVRMQIFEKVCTTSAHYLYLLFMIISIFVDVLKSVLLDDALCFFPSVISDLFCGRNRVYYEEPLQSDNYVLSTTKQHKKKYKNWL